MHKEKDLQDSINSLEFQIKKLNKRVEKQVSFKRHFAMAIMIGFAGALGATVVFAGALAGSIQVVRTINYVPILNNILNSQELEEVIKSISKFQ